MHTQERRPWRGCPKYDELAAFNRGDLAPPELERLAEHIGQCRACETILGGMASDTLVGKLAGSAPLHLDAECLRLEAAAKALAPESWATTVFRRLTRPGGGPWAEEFRPSELGPYDVLEQIARGGMGVVYKARDAALNRLVAIKLLPAGMDADPEAMTRFCVEAEACARLRHPNVVQVLQLGEHRGRLFFVMEYLEGGTLARRLRNGTMPPREAAALIATLARAVHHGHERKVIHRDLKPANVLFAADGTPKVADFGLAKLLDDTGALHTVTGVVLGTPAYMAPEQAEGHGQNVGPAADIWGLGILLYECLTGKHPFKTGSRVETLARVQAADVDRPSLHCPGLHPDLEAICLHSLQKEPKRRYLSAAKLADDLERWLDGRPTEARPLTHLQRLGRTLRRHKKRLALATVLLGLTALALATWTTPRPNPTGATERARLQIEESLARGETVTLVPKRGGPLWCEWVPGGYVGQITTSPEGFLEVSAWSSARLTLVRDPRVEHFLLRAEVRHDRAEKGAGVGLFVCQQVSATSDGFVHFFTRLMYDDVTDPREQFRLQRHLLLPTDKEPEGSNASLAATFQPATRNSEHYWDWPSAGRHSGLYTPAGFQGGRWRVLEVEVAPTGVRARFDGDTLDWIPAREIITQSRQKLQDVAGRPEGRVSSELDPRFLPRGRLGLYIANSKAAFCNVVLKPLSLSP
jgi:serine/threonine-protein kinase